MYLKTGFIKLLIPSISVGIFSIGSWWIYINQNNEHIIIDEKLEIEEPEIINDKEWIINSIEAKIGDQIQLLHTNNTSINNLQISQMDLLIQKKQALINHRNAYKKAFKDIVEFPLLWGSRGYIEFVSSNIRIDGGENSNNGIIKRKKHIDNVFDDQKKFLIFNELLVKNIVNGVDDYSHDAIYLHNTISNQYDDSDRKLQSGYMIIWNIEEQASIMHIETVASNIYQFNSQILNFHKQKTFVEQAIQEYAHAVKSCSTCHALQTEEISQILTTSPY